MEGLSLGLARLTLAPAHTAIEGLTLCLQPLFKTYAKDMFMLALLSSNDTLMLSLQRRHNRYRHTSARPIAY